MSQRQQEDVNPHDVARQVEQHEDRGDEQEHARDADLSSMSDTTTAGRGDRAVLGDHRFAVASAG